MKALAVILSLISSAALAAQNEAKAAEVFVPGGFYEPFFKEKNEEKVRIQDLFVDKFPVTNSQFLKFVKANPKWLRSRAPSVLAGAGYLKNWTTDKTVIKNDLSKPVVNVSWFAARAYCESQGKRLLAVNEWEYVSDSQDPKNIELILEWYGKSPDALIPVASSAKNKFGMHGMHGLIWEWTEDYSGVIIAGDSRDSNDTKANMFCGAGSLQSKDPTQYATFMRFAHRSSLTAEYVSGSLGFRCVRDK